MSFLRPVCHHTKFTFHNHDDVPNYDEHVAQIQKIYEGMSEVARIIIPGDHCSDIHIYASSIPERENSGPAMAKYAKAKRLIELPVRPDLSEVPLFLQPLYSDFGFTACHELHHPVVIKIAAPDGHNNEPYQKARKATLERIRQAYPQVQDILDPILAALRECDAAEKAAKPNLKQSVLQMPGIGGQLTAEEQVAFYAGLLLSDEYHKAFGYTMQVELMKPDTTYDEDLCNTKALAHRFGRDSVKAVAGELLTYVEGREALYKQLHDTKTAFADWQGTFDYNERDEWRAMIAALESQFPSGDPTASMGGFGHDGR